MEEVIEFRIFPSEDGSLKELIARHAAELGGPDGASGALLRDLVSVALESEYPMLRIVPRHDLASLDTSVVWYVYRDGHPLRRPHDGPGAMRVRDPLEVALSRSIRLLRESRRLVSASSRTYYAPLTQVKRRGLRPQPSRAT